MYSENLNKKINGVDIIMYWPDDGGICFSLKELCAALNLDFEKELVRIISFSGNSAFPHYGLHDNSLITIAMTMAWLESLLEKGAFLGEIPIDEIYNLSALVFNESRQN